MAVIYFPTVVNNLAAVTLGLVLTGCSPNTDSSIAKKPFSDLASLESALDLYRIDNGKVPTSKQGLLALIVKPTDPPIPCNWKLGGYIKRIPRDPWGREYKYVAPGRLSQYDIYTRGRDGIEGGRGYDCDIGNWNKNELCIYNSSKWYCQAFIALGFGCQE